MQFTATFKLLKNFGITQKSTLNIEERIKKYNKLIKICRKEAVKSINSHGILVMSENAFWGFNKFNNTANGLY